MRKTTFLTAAAGSFAVAAVLSVTTADLGGATATPGPPGAGSGAPSAAPMQLGNSPAVPASTPSPLGGAAPATIPLPRDNGNLTTCGGAAPTGASPSVQGIDCNTLVTFDVNAGFLQISVPTAVYLGAGDTNGTISKELGDVTVTDNRAALDAHWTATAVSSAFTNTTTGGSTGQETIPADDVEYWSGTASSTIGPGTFAAGEETSDNEVVLNTPRTAYTLTGGEGDNAATWNPTLEVNVPEAAVAGTYTGTVTHSVS